MRTEAEIREALRLVNISNCQERDPVKMLLSNICKEQAKAVLDYCLGADNQFKILFLDPMAAKETPATVLAE